MCYLFIDTGASEPSSATHSTTFYAITLKSNINWHQCAPPSSIQHCMYPVGSSRNHDTGFPHTPGAEGGIPSIRKNNIFIFMRIVQARSGPFLKGGALCCGRYLSTPTASSRHQLDFQSNLSIIDNRYGKVFINWNPNDYKTTPENIHCASSRLDKLSY